MRCLGGARCCRCPLSATAGVCGKLTNLMTADWPQLTLTNPAWLVALLVLPLLLAVARRSLVELSPWRRRSLLLVRTVIVLLLILSLSGLTGVFVTSQVHVVFLMDHSQSLDAAAQQVAAEFVQQATRERAETEFSLIPFAATPLATAVSLPETVDPWWSSATRLDTALQHAVACAPPQRVPRVVLLSDGRQTAGDVLQAAQRLPGPASVWTVPLPPAQGPDMQVTALQAPGQIARLEPFVLEVLVESDHADRVQVEVLRDAQVLVSELRNVVPGTNRFAFTQSVDSTALLTARIRSPTAPGAAQWQDTQPGNNQSTALVVAVDGPRVLLLEGAPDPGRALQRALEKEGLRVTPGSSADLPQTLPQLQPFDVVVLSNVPATELSTAQMQTLRTWVAALGGGLLMLGGDQSFGLGGYYRTAVDELLPVASDFRREQEQPGLAMMLVIDRSGSMGGRKIALARDAARAAAELLGSRDQLGIIAFDDAPVLVSGLAPLTDKAAVLSRIAAIEVGGGTSLYPAMEQAAAALQQTSAQLRHLIVLTDGYSTPGDFETLTRSLAAAEITVSAVGVGDADPQLLKSIARLGRGRYYFTNDPSAVPQIFAKETLTAGNQALQEQEFTPRVQQQPGFLQDIDFQTVPPLLGYVMTRPRPTSEVGLLAADGDPLLAWWRFGLGTTVAFTSDAGGRWGARWLSWEAYSRFWAQLIRFARRQSSQAGCHLDVQRNGTQVHVQVSASDAQGRFLNQAATEVRVVSPDSATISYQAEQTAPGQYTLPLTCEQPGMWQLHVSVSAEGQVLYQQSTGVAVDDRDELRRLPTDVALLQTLARTTGGRFAPEPQQVFDPDPQQVRRQHVPVWPWLLRLALLLWVLDVALRRWPERAAA